MLAVVSGEITLLSIVKKKKKKKQRGDRKEAERWESLAFQMTGRYGHRDGGRILPTLLGFCIKDIKASVGDCETPL